MPAGNIVDPHIIDAILAIAAALVAVLGPICFDMAQAERRNRRDR
jgi:hypothetical protein